MTFAASVSPTLAAEVLKPSPDVVPLAPALASASALSAPLSKESSSKLSNNASNDSSYQSMVLLKNIAVPAEGLPETFRTASEVLGVLASQSSWPSRLETLRRASWSLSKPEQKSLLASLRQQYQAQNTDINRYVTYGLADFIMTENKSSLYFFRKATESSQDPFLNLIYAMAQAQVDATIERALPSEMTARKLDVILRLRESVSMDTLKHTPGFWPVFVQVRQRLCMNPLYAQDLSDDFSLRYVPVGQSPFSVPTLPASKSARASARSTSPSKRPEASVSQPAKTASKAALLAVSASPQASESAQQAGLLQSNSLSANSLSANSLSANSLSANSLPAKLEASQMAPANLVSLRSIPLSPSMSHQVKFYANFSRDHAFTGVVTSSNEQIVAVLDGLNSTNIVEDLEGDGQFELVVRQFNQTPQAPVRVYRFVNGAYHLDERVASLFE
ncbi:MAG: hypothetical protein VKK59_01125 [Vampirovibrionales bacterium]|nr:hypothetical protein [Vampirovibrionales bacterium]